MKWIPMAAAILLGAACGSPAGPAGSELMVHPNDTSLRLENVSDRRIFYFLHERERAAAINWDPCVDLSRCASLAVGRGTEVPHTAIGGYAPGTSEVIVWWWESVPGPADGPVPGEIHSLVVRL